MRSISRLGYSLEQAGGVVALMTVMQAVGRLSGGWLGDRFSKRRIAAACMLGHAVALLVLAKATAFVMVLASPCCTGSRGACAAR